MKNFVQDGNTMTYTAPADVSSGDVVKINNIVGIVKKDAKAGEEMVLVLVGVFKDLAKETGQSWSEGEAVYWDNANSRFTKTSAGNTEAGTAAEDATSAAGTGIVRLGVQTQPGA